MLRHLVICLSAFGILWALPASAVQYEADIHIESELDLYEMEQDGEISEETLETLLELLRVGVDLNRATREELYVLPNLTYAEVDAIIAYREQAGAISEVEELVVAGAITPDQLIQLAPFLLVIEDPRVSLPVSGRLRLMTAYMIEDPVAPPVLLQGRIKAPMGFSAGLLSMTTRQRPGSIQYDPTVGQLHATLPGYSVQLPKIWVRFKNGPYDLLLGSFRIGFGQRLTLDNTTRLTPDGFYQDDAIYLDGDPDRVCAPGTIDPDTGVCPGNNLTSYMTSDFSWRDGFRGIAGTLRDVQLADELSLSATAFASYQDRDVYQYHLVDRTRCDDPRNEGADCGSPPIFVSTPDRGVTTGRHTFTTFPDVFQEVAGGFNTTFKFGARGRLGVTGYGAIPVWPNSDQLRLDLQEFSKYPDNGPYGAIGVDGATGFGPVNLFIEATRSFDSIEGRGGDWAVLQRSVLARKKEELELSLRYYGRDFDNPYSRGISQPDMVEGIRVRNEAGARLRYYNRAIEGWQLRGSADFWVWPGDGTIAGTAGRTNLNLTGRVDYVDFPLLQPSIWFTHTNKDLRSNFDPGNCYDLAGADGTDEEDACSGEAYRVGVRLRFNPMRQFQFTVQYNHALYDTIYYDAQHMHDVRALAEAVIRPIPTVRIRVRTRWLEDDLLRYENGQPLEFRFDRGEGSLWSTVDATYNMPGSWRFRLRYDNYWWIDGRASTANRTPNPENRFRAEVEARF